MVGYEVVCGREIPRCSDEHLEIWRVTKLHLLLVVEVAKHIWMACISSAWKWNITSLPMLPPRLWLYVTVCHRSDGTKTSGMSICIYFIFWCIFLLHSYLLINRSKITGEFFWSKRVFLYTFRLPLNFSLNMTFYLHELYQYIMMQINI